MKTISLKFSIILLVINILTGFSFCVSAQFVPGEGGAIPPAPVFTPLQNTVPGLYVSSVQRKNWAFIGGTYNEVNLNFPSPSVTGAESYVLQAYNTTEAKWENFKHQGEDVTTSSGDNFSIISEKPEKFRLLLVGGEKNGWTTNEAVATVSGINTYFSGWSLDESMWISGVMAPYVGRGLQASFTVAKLEDNSQVADALSYQWYRVNPATFEFVKIDGATDTKYITSMTDAGFALAIRATGDNTKAGGFTQVISSWPNIHQVKVFATNVSESGFKLNFYNLINDIDTSYFSLVDNEYLPVKINAITKAENAAIYSFSALLKPEKAPYMLTNNWEKAKYWHLASEIFPGHLMPMLNIEFPSEVQNVHDAALKIYPQPAENYFSFKFTENVQRINVYNIKGEMVRQFVTDKPEGTISTEDINSGFYLLKFETTLGTFNRKLLINK